MTEFPSNSSSLTPEIQAALEGGSAERVTLGDFNGPVAEKSGEAFIVLPEGLVWEDGQVVSVHEE